MSGESARQGSLWNDKQTQASQGYSRIHSFHSHSLIFIHSPCLCSPSLSRPCAYARQASPTYITESFVYTLHSTERPYISVCYCCLVTKPCPTLLQPHGLQPARLLCPWDFSGKNTRVYCHFLLQGIVLTQGSNPCLLHWQADSLPPSHLGRPSKCFSSVQWLSCVRLFVTHGPQHARPHCPSSTPGVYSNSSPLSQ